MNAPDFKKDFDENYVKGDKALPHFKPMPYAEFLNRLAAGGHSMPSRFGYARLQGESGYTGWTMFFLNTTQGGAIDGTGILVRYNNKEPITGTFAICDHEKVDGHGANHSRGWHPGSCGKCGLNMTVDSSD